MQNSPFEKNALQQAAFAYTERVGREAPKALPRLFGFERLWRRVRPPQKAPLAARPSARAAAPWGRKWRRQAAMALAMMALFTVTVSAVSLDDARWENAFKILNSLGQEGASSQALPTLPPDGPVYGAPSEVAFVLDGAEYSTEPTLGELLWNGWQVESRESVGGYYRQDETFYAYVNGYWLVKGEQRLRVRLYDSDLRRELAPTECRVVTLDFYFGQVESLSVAGQELCGGDLAAAQAAWGDPGRIVEGLGVVSHFYYTAAPGVAFVDLQTLAGQEPQLYMLSLCFEMNYLGEGL